MRHTREEVIERIIKEFELLDRLVAHLTEAQWQRPLRRPESKDPWTVKDALAHITHWKADVIRSMRGEPISPEERGLTESAGNHLVYMRWRDRPAREVLAWHRQVQREALAALRQAPEEWFSKRDRRAEWPYDLVGHSAYHRVKDIEQVLAAGK
jgi:uncharacterized damage-inducible protein DinB